MQHGNSFAELYNSEVVSKMNEIASRFPSTSDLTKDFELTQAGFLDLIKKSHEDQELIESIKNSSSQTQSY